MSYGFIKEGYDPCPGYWVAALNWHEGKFNPQGWMMDLVMGRLESGAVGPVHQRAGELGYAGCPADRQHA